MQKTLTLLFLVFILLVPTVILAQKTVEVLRIDTLNMLQERFYVLKSDSSIREGPFVEYMPNYNFILTKGFYKNNLKDSIWKQYDLRNNLLEEGSYKEGKKVGIWTAYAGNGDTVVKYDYSNSKLLVYKTNKAETSKPFIVINGGDKRKAKLDRVPIYINGRQMAGRTFMLRFRKPKSKQDNNATGTVIVGFTIGIDGKTSDYHVVQSVSQGYDESAMVAVKALDGDWLPAILNGKPVVVIYTIPFDINIRNDKKWW